MITINSLELTLSRAGLGEDSIYLSARDRLRLRKDRLDRLILHGIPVDYPTNIHPPPTVVCPGDGSPARPYRADWAVPSP